MINANILQVKKCHLLIKVKLQRKLSHLGKALVKQIKTIENQGRKQAEMLKFSKSIEGIFQKELTNNEIKTEVNEITKLKEKLIKIN